MTEAQFSRRLVTWLRDKGHCQVQRIESPETSVGIPDLYLRYKHREIWVELKSMPRVSIRHSMWDVPWRKGQQAWALEYHRRCDLSTYTFVQMEDGCVLIEMDRLYANNHVYNFFGDHPILMETYRDFETALFQYTGRLI